MPAVAERAINRNSPDCGARISKISATMIGRCVPAGVLPDARTFSTVSGVTLRIVLLVFLLEAPRILTAVTRTARGRGKGNAFSLIPLLRKLEFRVHHFGKDNPWRRRIVPNKFLSMTPCSVIRVTHPAKCTVFAP